MSSAMTGRWVWVWLCPGRTRVVGVFASNVSRTIIHFSVGSALEPGVTVWGRAVITLGHCPGHASVRRASGPNDEVAWGQPCPIVSADRPGLQPPG